MRKGRRPVRVLHINYSLNRGGAETWLVNMMRFFDRSGYEFDFLLQSTTPCAFCSEIESMGGRILDSGSIKKPLRYAMRFVRAIKEYGPYDIVHSHSGLLSAFDCILARIAGVPAMVVHFRTAYDGGGSSLLWQLFRVLSRYTVRLLATMCLGVSLSALESLVGSRGWDNSQYGVLYSGVNLEPFLETQSADEIRDALGIPATAPVVGHVGNFRKPKNHQFIVQVAKSLVRVLPNVVFLLIGTGELADEVMTLVKNLRLENSFVFAGEQDDVPSLLGSVDCFLFPSLWEGLPQALVEAQASGLQCIVSDRVTTEAIMIPSLVRRLSLSQSAEEWAGAIRVALESPNLDSNSAVSMIAGGRGDVKHSMKTLGRAYQHLLSRRIQMHIGDTVLNKAIFSL